MAFPSKLLWLILMMLVSMQLGEMIQISPDSTATTTTTTTTTNFKNILKANISNFSGPELSASERTRRLIPYMAFYMPQQDYPINQQYVAATQRPEQQQQQYQQQQQQQHYQDQGQQHQFLQKPQQIDIGGSPPATYVRVQVPNINLHNYQQQQQQKQPDTTSHSLLDSNREAYHTFVYGGQQQQQQYPLTQVKENNKNANYQLSPLSRLLPPIPMGSTVPPFPYKSTNLSSQKSVIVYQPLESQPNQQHHQQQNSLSAKINLTPFTPSNTVPGQFIPIIYTTNEKQQQQKHPNNFINYNNNRTPSDAGGVISSTERNAVPPPPPPLPSFGTKLQPHYRQPFYQQSSPSPSKHHSDEFRLHNQQQHQHHHSYQQSSNVVHSSTSEENPTQSLSDIQIQKQQQQQQQHPNPNPNQHRQHFHVQFISVTPTATPSHIYHVITESPSTSVRDQHESKEQSYDTGLKTPYSQNHYEYLNSPSMTPQQKYVAYLQHQMRYNSQRHQQQQQKQEHQFQHQTEPKQKLYSPQSRDIVVISTTPQSSAVDIPSSSSIYPQHSPIGHAVHPQLQLEIPSNHQRPSVHHQLVPIRSGHQQQTTESVPSPSSSSSSSNLAQNHEGRIEIITEIAGQRPHHRYQIHSSNRAVPSTSPAHHQQQSNFIEYIIDNDPKQTIDDELPTSYHQRQRPIILLTTTPATSSAVTTPLPTDIYATSPRPGSGSVYKTPSTLRLHAIQANQQRQAGGPISQSPTTSSKDTNFYNRKEFPTSTPKFVYVSAKPKYTQIMPTIDSTKLKSSYNFEPSVKISPPDEMLTPPISEDEQHKYQQQHQQQQKHQAEQQQQNYHQLVEQNQRPSKLYPTTPQSSMSPHLHMDDSLPDIRTSSLAEILHKLQESNHLPQTLTPDNIDNSIRTLITILNNLKQSQIVIDNPSQHHDESSSSSASSPTLSSSDYDYATGSEEEQRPITQDLSITTQLKPMKKPGPNTGRPGIDYPNFAEIPKTSFDCGQQRYKGFFGDPETNCQVWHYCDLNGGKASFLCPNGTIFSQIALTCDWWFNVKCSTTSQLYVLNERLYKYILPFTPKFPEDYSGPLVDKYLAIKFQEMEEKMRREKLERTHEEEKMIVEGGEEMVKITTPTEVDDGKTLTTMEHVKYHESINSQVGEQSSEKNLLIDDEVENIVEREGKSAAFITSNSNGNNYKDNSSSSSSINSSTITNSIISSSDSITTANANEELPLSLKPIVVSTTALPEFRQKEMQQAEIEEKKSSSEEYKLVHHHPSLESSSSRISVEKVEVIEIKSDGSSGHLTPLLMATKNNNDPDST